MVCPIKIENLIKSLYKIFFYTLKVFPDVNGIVQQKWTSPHHQNAAMSPFQSTAPTSHNIKCVYDGRASPHSLRGVSILRGGFGWRCVSLHQSDRKSDCLSPTASSIFSLVSLSVSLALSLRLGQDWSPMLHCLAAERLVVMFGWMVQQTHLGGRKPAWCGALTLLWITHVCCVSVQVLYSLFRLTGLTWVILIYCCLCEGSYLKLHYFLSLYSCIISHLNISYYLILIGHLWHSNAFSFF